MKEGLQSSQALAFHVAFHHDGLSKVGEAGPESTQRPLVPSKMWHFKCSTQQDCSFKISGEDFKESTSRFKVHVATTHHSDSVKRESYLK